MSALTAIGSACPSAPQGASSKAALHAQLQRREKERSDCVNCPSAETMEGKQNIQKLDATIKRLQEQLGIIRQGDAVELQSAARNVTATLAAGRLDVYA